MIRRFSSIALLALAIIVAPRLGRAQEVATAGTTSLDPAAVSSAPVVAAPAVDQAAPAGPTLDGATVGFHRANTQTTHAPVTVATTHSSNSTALMIVGGAAFLAGAVIGGDAGTIIMIGGAAVGLYGLYLYLQ
jgi:hypothetical protein